MNGYIYNIHTKDIATVILNITGSNEKTIYNDENSTTAGENGAIGLSELVYKEGEKFEIGGE